MKQRLVLYHANCVDGFTSAWAAWRAFGDEHTEYRPTLHSDFPKDVAGRDVYLLDICYPREVMLQLARAAASVMLIDHHRTAMDDLASIKEELDNVRRVSLSNGAVAYVDSEDLDLVARYSWSAAKHGGAIAYAGGGRANQTQISMHRLITGAPSGTMIDHVNRNSLDNRRANLRPATRQQNAANMDRGSLLKGVAAHGDRWMGRIMVDGKHVHLGVFDTAEDAARAYDDAARKAFGSYARCNFGDTCDPVPATFGINFDMERSGAGMSWDILHEGKPRPWLVDYVEDRDLWRFKLPDTHAINAWINACRRNRFEDWDELCALGPEVAKERGKAVEVYVNRYVSEMSAQARRIDFEGYSHVPIVNAPYIGISELVGKLAEDAPLAIGWSQRGDGTYTYSLRSNAKCGNIDVSAIAKRYGGGGHRNSAAFTRPKPPEAYGW